jgi:hypothetical protein
MPEVAVDKHGDPAAAEYDVWPAHEITRLKPEATTAAVKLASQS